MEMQQTALVLGASGGIGGEVARQLLRQGWRVRAMKRTLTPTQHDGIEWVSGDAMDGAAVRRAAEGCGVIVHAVNPPGYLNWDQQVLPMLDNSIAAASLSGATVVLPGTLYNFGPDAFPLVQEQSPQNPLTRKGRIRVELEARLQRAAQAGKIRVIIVRAGDFFGPGARNNWFSQGMIKPGSPPAQVSLPALPGVGHHFAYLPDVAACMVELLQLRHQLPVFARYHMVGHWDDTGREMGRAVQRVLRAHGAREPRLRALPWWLFRLLALFNTTLREMMEMRYLWQTEVRMANMELRAVLGREPHTPLDVAVERTLDSLGCLPLASADDPKVAGRPG